VGGAGSNNYGFGRGEGEVQGKAYRAAPLLHAGRDGYVCEMLSGVGQFLGAGFVGPGYVPVHLVVHR
jgi:hypothetical protein